MAYPTQAELIAAIRAFALTNYEKDGWDYLVECWDDEEICESMGDAKTVAQAIANCRHDLKMMDEQRREIQSAEF